MARYIDAEIAKECFDPSDLDGDCFDNYDNVIRILNVVQTEDVVGRNSVLEMLSKINNAVEDGDGFQYEEWMEYVKGMEE